MISAPNLLTLCNLLTGFLSIGLTLKGRWVEGSWLVFLSCLLDGADGKIAKWLGQETRFGCFFDASADFVSLGVAPALSFAAGAGWGAAALSAASFYVAASVFRLARFYLESAGRTTDRQKHYFVGLPVTSAAALNASSTLLSTALGLPRAVCLWAPPIAAALMVSRFRFANPKHIPLRPFLPKIVLSAAVAVGAAFLTRQLSSVPFSLSVCYMLFGRPGRSQSV